MKDNFNIYKWRRDQLTENENTVKGEWRDDSGEWNGKKYDGMFRTYTKEYLLPTEHYAEYGDAIKKMIEDKGYTFIGNDEVEVGSTTQRHMYYYTK